MFRIAKREELDWRKLQAEEIKAMLFRSPQPGIMREGIKQIQFNVVIEVDDDIEGDRELADLQAACGSLDEAISRIGESDDPWQAKGKQSMGGGPRKPAGPGEIPVGLERGCWSLWGDSDGFQN
jgi:hypothetical protein